MAVPDFKAIDSFHRSHFEIQYVNKFSSPKQARNFINVISNTCIHAVSGQSDCHEICLFRICYCSDIFQCGSKMIKPAGLASIHRAASPNNAPTIMNVRKNKGFQLRKKIPVYFVVF